MQKTLLQLRNGKEDSNSKTVTLHTALFLLRSAAQSVREKKTLDEEKSSAD